MSIESTRLPFRRWKIAIVCALVLLPSAVRAQNPYSATFFEGRQTFGQFGRAVAFGDFDGDGRDDLAVGVPNHNTTTAVFAGRVCVYFGSSGTISRTCIFQGSTSSQETGDQFGFSLAFGDFNGDGFDDLAVGVPGEDLGNQSNAGAVQIFAGNSSRTFSPRIFFQGPPYKGSLEAGDRFGHALAVGDFDANGFDDLAVGVPGEDLGTVPDAGVVQVLYGAGAGLGAFDQIWAQDQGLWSRRRDDQESAQPFDQFGYSLAVGKFNGDAADDLVIGVPFEDVRRFVGGVASDALDAGVVHVIHGRLGSGLTADENELWHQDLPLGAEAGSYWTVPEMRDLFGFAVAAGDLNADGLDDLVIGVPGENEDRGGVHVLRGQGGWQSIAGLTAVGSVFWSHRSGAIWLMPGDQFGRALTFGDFNGDGIDDLVIGSPGDDVSVSTPNGWITVANAGSGSVVFGEPSFGIYAFVLNGPGDLHQNNGSTPNLETDAAESQDMYGYVLAAGDLDGDGADDLAVGIPFEDTLSISGTALYPDAGAVEVLWGYVWQ